MGNRFSKKSEEGASCAQTKNSATKPGPVLKPKPAPVLTAPVLTVLNPHVLWADRSDSIFLTIHLADVVDMEFDITETSISFQGKVQGKEGKGFQEKGKLQGKTLLEESGEISKDNQISKDCRGDKTKSEDEEVKLYGFKLELNGAIKKDEVKIQKKHSVIEVHMSKAKKGSWGRLSKDKHKFVSVDWAKFVDSDEEVMDRLLSGTEAFARLYEKVKREADMEYEENEGDSEGDSEGSSEGRNGAEDFDDEYNVEDSDDDCDNSYESNTDGIWLGIWFGLVTCLDICII